MKIGIALVLLPVLAGVGFWAATEKWNIGVAMGCFVQFLVNVALVIRARKRD